MNNENPNKLFRFEIGTLTPHGIMSEALNEVLNDVNFLKRGLHENPTIREGIEQLESKIRAVKEIYQGNNEKLIRQILGIYN